MPFTPEELAAITQSITESLKPVMAEIANTAATSHAKRLEQKLAAAAPPPAPETPKPAAPTVSPEVDAKIKASPELAALQATLAETKKLVEQEREGRIKAETTARENAAYSALKSNLTGIKPELQEAAAKLLFHVDKRVTFDADGTPLFKMKDADGQDVEMLLADGVSHWVKSKEAAAFLPAPGGTPGVGRGGGAPTAGAIPKGRSANGMPIYDSPASSDAERFARAAQTADALKKAFGDDIF